jgi:hypothetical protein
VEFTTKLDGKNEKTGAFPNTWNWWKKKGRQLIYYAPRISRTLKKLYIINEICYFHNMKVLKDEFRLLIVRRQYIHQEYDFEVSSFRDTD